MRDNRHGSVDLFGALRPSRATGAAIIMPDANSEAMGEHLKEIATQIASGGRAVLVCDGAGWRQRGARLTIPDNITVLPLPPYSPELNPMENVWDPRLDVVKIWAGWKKGVGNLALARFRHTSLIRDGLRAGIATMDKTRFIIASREI